jgi:hypothetical protein
MLYGSWKYVNKHRSTVFTPDEIQNKMNTVDLIVFARKNALKVLPSDCRMFYTANGRRTRQDFKENASCWLVEQQWETGSDYKNLNSYIMFLRRDIENILKSYTFVLRTDMDVFLTPKFFTYRPTLKVVTGFGAYCNDFNRARLKDISHQLGMKHRDVHCIGSSWYGLTSHIIELSKQAYNISLYLYDNQFRNGLNGLESFDFNKEPGGRWPEWYRLTSTMYGSEIVLNNFPNFSMENMKRFDISTCNPWTISLHYQLHAYHTECEFNKKRFLTTITEIAIGTSQRRDILQQKLQKYSEMTISDVETLNTTDYSTFIAWHSAAKYLTFRYKI